MILAGILLAAALSAGNAAFDRTAAEGAASISFARVRAELVAKGPGEGALAEAMLADPARFRTREASEKLCRALYTNEVRHAYDTACAKIRKELDLGDDYAAPLSERDRVSIDGLYRRTFTEARTLAVARQATGLIAGTRPTEAEIEAKDEATLRREMTERILAEQKTPVFEENVDYVSARVVGPILESARDERKRQADYLGHVPCEALAPSRLAAELRQRLEGDVAERAKKEGAKAWGVFPSVLAKKLPEAVAHRTLARFKDALASVVPDVTAAEVAATIASDPKAHIRAAESQKIFMRGYAAKLTQDAIGKMVAAAPAAERTELDAYLKAQAGDERFVKAAREVVRREMLPKWKAARAEAGARQAAATWPTLGDGTWYPAPELADEVAARSDYAAAVKDWRKLSALKALAEAPGAETAMEEASAQADAEVAAAFDRARNAIAAQNRIVDALHPELLATLRAETSGFFSWKPSVKKIAARLTALTEARWAAARYATLWPEGPVPANAAEQHAGLFPSVRKKIELLAKTLREELDDKPPEEPKPEEPPPEETPPEEKLAFSLSIEREGNRIELKLLEGTATRCEKSVEATRAPFAEAMGELADRLGRDFLKLPERR